MRPSGRFETDLTDKEWELIEPLLPLPHDGCPDSTGKRIGIAAESQAARDQPDDLAARAGAGNHAADVNGSWRPLPESASRRSSRCVGQGPEHTSCSGPGFSPGIPGSSTRQTQIRQWNERLLDPGDFGGSPDQRLSEGAWGDMKTYRASDRTCFVISPTRPRPAGLSLPEGALSCCS